MNVSIREAAPEDTERVVAYVRRLIAEPGVGVTLGIGEFDVTVEEERQVLARYAASENSAYLIAETEDAIAGMLICTGGRRRATRHVVTLGGMSVPPRWRRQRIASRPVARALEWAGTTGTVRRVELSVFASNRAAIHLYQQFGFRVEGRRREAI